MSYVDPKIKEQFDTLPTELRNEILNLNVNIHSMADLINVLEDIVREG